MKRDELIEALKAIPENLEVRIIQHAHCCCGECFLPLDDESAIWQVDKVGGYKKEASYILIT